MRVYLINWSQFIMDYLIIALRVPLIISWCEACIKPIKELHETFISYRNHSLYRVQHNSQIASIEAVLNDSFDNIERRIRIINVAFKEAVHFYEPEEQREVFFYEPEQNLPVFFYNPEDLSGEGVDFIVCVPPELRPEEIENETTVLIQMSGLIDYYKLYSKNYKIVWQLVSV